MKSDMNKSAESLALRPDAAGNGADKFEKNKDKMLADLRVLVADAEVLMRDAAGTSAEGFAALSAGLEEKLNGAKAEVRRARGFMTATTRQATDATQAYVSGNPWKLAAVSAALGLLCGLLLTPRNSPLDTDASR